MNIQLKYVALIFILLSILFSGCKKDDDDDNSQSGPNSGQPTYLRVTKSGTVYQDGSETFIYDNGAIEYVSVYSESPYTSAGLEFANIPGVGSYSANSELGFAFGIDTEFWFSTSSTTITIEVHNQTTNFVKGNISGTMETLGGASTTSSITAEFAFVY